MRKLKDDDIIERPTSNAPSLKLRRIIVLTLCPALSLLLIVGMVVDALPRRPVDDVNAQQHRQRLERTLEAMEELGAELATGGWPQSSTYGRVPCAINVSGFACPNSYGAELNALYTLEKTLDTNRSPAYRSMEGYWLVHSPHRCFLKATWLITKVRPDESDQSANAPHGGCDIEANIWHSSKLPVGNLAWSYVSCGTAGDANTAHRRLTLEPVKQCDCPTAGHTSERQKEAAPPAAHES